MPVRVTGITPKGLGSGTNDGQYEFSDGQFARSITVDSNGGGEFASVQAAINSVADGNRDWILINIKAGIYREKVTLPKDKSYLVIRGERPESTIIEWNTDMEASLWTNSSNLAADVLSSATFTSSASDIVFQGITIKNTYEGQNGPKAAIALAVSGDRTSFYSCRFIGIQDTLCDNLGRHYFHDCYIEGSVDFIFGYARSTYENCNINTVPDKGLKAGWITANGRRSLDDASAYVFKFCKISGSFKTYLGRAWNKYSRVIFYRTDMSNCVVPQGWDNWATPDKGASTTFAEAECSGTGAVVSQRVKWEKKLRPEELEEFISTNQFINYDGWLDKQPH
ncbi:hypothetical protein HPP92_005100 [Vanilla planifolia]|uniref:Pectinesterase n=1 Tax=Vanilla planifolia TaxID=51239 RepID=A0A835RL22_VANPL|nr:hypothetical protein HPP92_005100 [Vanilla planifolia]